MSLDALKFVIEDEAVPKTRIRVFGVGGGGSNAVARMLHEGLAGVEFCVLNTDVQALAASPVPNQLTIGAKVTNGLGAGSDPAVGRQAALEDTEKIIDLLEGADMVFVTAGLGGGTGTGATPVVASLAKELGALTVAVVTKPFAFEGPKRRKQADHGLAELASVVDTIITIPNDQLLDLVPRGTSFQEAFRVADDVLRQAVQGISDIITTPGLINRDFSDIRTIMLGMGYAMMGTASASGENAPVLAAQKAISCPLMEAGGVKGSRGVLINITGSSRLSLHEVNEACTLIRQATENEDVQINFGVVMDEAMGDEVKITVIATGFERASLPAIERRATKVTAAAAPASVSVPAPVEEPAPPPQPVQAELPQPQEEEQMMMAAAANGDDLDVPAILRRDRRMVQ
jgi:cell division protein FtsZ